MTPSKVVFCVLGAVTLLNAASANPFAPTMKYGKGKAVPVSRSVQDIQRASKQVGEIVRRLGQQQAARRLQGGGGVNLDGAPQTTVTVYADRDTGEMTCDISRAIVIEQADLQEMIDSEKCMPIEHDDTSESLSFDGRSVVLRTFEGGNCAGKRTVRTYPCGCSMGVVIAGHLCEEVPPPAAHITLNLTDWGMCASAPSWAAATLPIWEGCYHASHIFFGDAIGFVQETLPGTEVYASIRSTEGATSLVYSIHSDMNCQSRPYEVLSLSCECYSRLDERMGRALHSSHLYLTGEYCASTRPSDLSVFGFHAPSPEEPTPCSFPTFEVSIWLDVCMPSMCTREDCEEEEDQSSIRASRSTSGTVHIIDYIGFGCRGRIRNEYRFTCGQCQVDEDEDGSRSYLKMMGSVCFKDERTCAKAPLSLFLPEVEDHLMPCLP